MNNNLENLNIIKLNTSLIKFDGIIRSIELDNKEYVFKDIPKNIFGQYKLEYYYNSLIIKYICDEIKIDCCDVQIAWLKNRLVILSPDYRKTDFEYISGQEILLEYLYYLKENNLIKKYLDEETPDRWNIGFQDYLVNKMNNLETIWDAINYHYRNEEKSKREIQVTNIMIEQVKRYSLDLLVLQNDRHEKNWEIEENETTALLTPLYDNELAFDFLNYIPEI